jgi:hypothetical protein
LVKQRDGGKRLLRIERHLLQQEGRAHLGADAAHVKRIPVGRRVRHDLTADDAAHPGAIVDDDLLAPALADLHRDEARGDVGRASGRAGDQAHGPVGKAGSGARSVLVGGSRRRHSDAGARRKNSRENETPECTSYHLSSHRSANIRLSWWTTAVVVDCLLIHYPNPES